MRKYKNLLLSILAGFFILYLSTNFILFLAYGIGLDMTSESGATFFTVFVASFSIYKIYQILEDED